MNRDKADSSATPRFSDLKTRLDEIVEIVSDDTLPLEEALKYYEEAVTLGLEASNILEQGIAEHNTNYELAQNEQNTTRSVSEEPVDVSADSSH